ncbi:MAG: 50S ribosomal protein L23 [Candidatus Anstonellales archaeon]
MIIKKAVKTEKFISKVDFEGKITLEVDLKATKKEIIEEFEKVSGEKVKKINIYITPAGKKRAVIKLADPAKAEDVALKFKLV